MNVFNGSTQIRRAVADPITDHKLPNPKSLSWRAITTPIAVQGTKGTNCELIHGDRSYVVRGDHDEKVTGNQTIQVGANHKETIVGKCQQNIIGQHNVTNHTTRHETRLGAFTKIYGDFFTRDDHDGQMVTAGSHLEADGIQIALYGFDFEGYGAAVYATHVFDCELTSLHIEIHDVCLQVHEMDNQFHLTNMENGVLKMKNGVEIQAKPTANAANNLHLPSSVL